jgi:hypothetical protein
MRLPTSHVLLSGFVALAVLSSACEDEDTKPSPPRDAGTTADRPPDVAPDAGTPADTGAGDAATAGYFPCNVEAVLKAKCHTCHIASEPRPMGAPFSLITYADTQAPYKGMPSLKIYQVMKTAVESGFMPLSTSPTGPLLADEKTTLLAWLNAGALAAATPCATTADASAGS